MRFQITLLAAVLLTAPSNLQAAEPDPTSLLRALRGPDADRDAAVREILAAPERAAPPVLYALSGALLQRGAADDAAFWYLAAQLRLGHAVDRCVGETDRFLGPLFIAELTEDFSARIVRHMVADPVRLNAMIARVVDWDRRTPEAYAPEWLLWRIYLRAPHAEDLVPRADWPALAERARTEFAKRWADGVAWLRASRPLESGAWEIGDVAVYHLRGGRERVAHADAATFRPLNETFARDLDRAFAEIRLIPGADVASFEALSPAFARDAKRVYRYDEPVEGADPATFVPLDEDWGRDARFVYRRTLRFPKCDPGTFHRVGEHLYADRATVYFDEMPGATGDFFVKRIPGVDFATFVQLNGTYARDARRVYVDGAELPGADAATFSVVGLFAARDVHRCYAMEHPLPCSDAVVLPRDYPSSHTKMGPDDLLLAETRGPLLHGREKVSIDPDWTVGYESDGFLVVPRGDYEVPIRCEEGEGNFSRGTFEPARGLESGRLYMLERGRNPGCVAEASGVAMVRGSIDGPPVWLRMDGKPSVQKVFPAGRHTLTAVCRRVTRTELVEREATLTLELEAGEIYELEGTFTDGDARCALTARKRSAGARQR